MNYAEDGGRWRGGSPGEEDRQEVDKPEGRRSKRRSGRNRKRGYADAADAAPNGARAESMGGSKRSRGSRR